MSGKWIQRSLSILGLALLAACGWFLYHELHTLNLHKVTGDIAALSPVRIFLTFVLVVFAYLVILGYDFLGLKFVRQALPIRRIVFASFVSSAFSNTVALPVLGVGGTRFRLYKQWNLPAVDIAYLISFIGISNWMGLLTLTGTFCLIASPHIPNSAAVSDLLVRIFACLFLAAAASALLVCAVRSQIHFARWSLRLPSFRLTIAQWSVGIADWVFQAAIFYTVLNAPDLSLHRFLPTYFAAMILAMFAHLPAGLGVFDVGILVMLKPFVPADQIVSALLLYRAAYHLLPLALATVLFATHEILLRFKQPESPQSAQ